jgi:hypothetical protein
VRHRLVCSNYGGRNVDMVVTKRSPSARCSAGMRSAENFRKHAERARRLADMLHQPEIEECCGRVAQGYDEMADRLERGQPLSAIASLTA